MAPVVASCALSDVPMKRATNPVPDQAKRGFVGSVVSTRPTQRTPAATTSTGGGGAPAVPPAPDPAVPPAPDPAAPPAPEPPSSLACSPPDEPQPAAGAISATTIKGRQARVSLMDVPSEFK